MLHGQRRRSPSAAPSGRGWSGGALSDSRRGIRPRASFADQPPKTWARRSGCRPWAPCVLTHQMVRTFIARLRRRQGKNQGGPRAARAGRLAGAFDAGEIPAHRVPKGLGQLAGKSSGSAFPRGGSGRPSCARRPPRATAAIFHPRDAMSAVTRSAFSESLAVAFAFHGGKIGVSCRLVRQFLPDSDKRPVRTVT
jgi:hypothetical protein